MAHRISWALENGPVPEGMMVLHSCDNPGCVNPAHLFLGTHFDNMRDMVAKKRQARGESVYRSKLTAEDVREIRQLIAIGRSHGGIAREYGVLRTAIGNINTGYTWAWLK